MLAALEAANRVHATADAIARFHHRNLGAGAFEIARGGQARQAGASNDDADARHSVSIKRIA